ncbi:MAG: hypothetical protein SLRJCFUN_001316 [Candidatus Fervidibacter sp.]
MSPKLCLNRLPTDGRESLLPRCFWVLSCVAAMMGFASADSPSLRNEGATQRKVFVDIDRLMAATPVSLPPCSPAQQPLRLEGGAITLLPVPFLAPSENWADIAQWQRGWEASLEREHRFAVTPPSLPFAPRLASPLSASATDNLSWLAERFQEQAFERARLHLRLTFADRLSPAERMRLEQRWRELDEQLRPPSPPPSPTLPSPQPPSPLPFPNSLTDANQIAVLLAPPLSPPTGLTKVSSDGQETFESLTSRRHLSGWQETALKALAQAFALAYGKQKGWRVVFKPSPFTLDKTEEVLTAWRRWWASKSP